MLNLVRMNVYRMIHTKSMWIIFISMIMFATLNDFMLIHEMDSYTEQDLYEIYGQQNQDAYEINEDDFNFGIYSNLPVDENGIKLTALGNFTTNLNSCILLISITIAAALFCNAESKHGFIKNIAGHTKSMVSIYMSKIIAVIFYIVICYIAYFITDYITISVCTGEVIDLYNGNIGRILMCIGIQFILHIAFMCGIELLVEFTKSASASITIGLFAAFGMGTLICNVIYLLTDFNTMKYSVVNNVKAILPDVKDKVLITALIVGIIYIIVYNVAGSLIVKKRDVV